MTLTWQASWAQDIKQLPGVTQPASLHGLHWSKPYLHIVSGEDFPEIKDLKHGSCTVVSDAVTLQNILCYKHFPSQPTLPKGSIKRKHVRKVAWFTATKTFIFLYTFSDGLYFSLLTVSSLGENRRKKKKSWMLYMIANLCLEDFKIQPISN